MYGAKVLQNISDIAAKAAAMYPHVLRLLIDAGIPPDQRAAVLDYLRQVVELDSRTSAKYIN